MPDDEQIIPGHKKLDKGDLFWLVYLLFFLIEPFAQHSLVVWLRTLGEISLFVGLYLLFLRFCDVRLRLAALCGMAVLGFATYPSNAGGSCFLIYAGALLPFVTASLPWIVTGLVLESVLLAMEGFAFHISPYSWFSSILLIGGVGGSNIYFAQKQRADRKLRRKQEEIEALAAVAERERIARDLHDVLGHTLSVIVLKSELAGRLLQRALSDPGQEADKNQHEQLQRAHAEVRDVERTARTALAEVREAIGGYRTRGLHAEVEAARRTLAAANVTLITTEFAIPAVLSAAEETVLSLALREAVTNIVRHAAASTCRLQWLRDAQRHRLCIQDDGQHPARREGNGLRGMRERVESLGGQLSLTREAGTCLQIELPLQAAP